MGLCRIFYLTCALLLFPASFAVVEGTRPGCRGELSGCLGHVEKESYGVIWRAQIGAEKWTPPESAAAAALGQLSWANQLRLVPSGPNPLHHNGSPRKAKTP